MPPPVPPVLVLARREPAPPAVRACPRPRTPGAKPPRGCRPRSRRSSPYHRCRGRCRSGGDKRADCLSSGFPQHLQPTVTNQLQYINAYNVYKVCSSQGLCEEYECSAGQHHCPNCLVRRVLDKCSTTQQVIGRTSPLLPMYIPVRARRSRRKTSRCRTADATLDRKPSGRSG